MVNQLEEVRKRLETNRDLNDLISTLGDDFKPARAVADSILEEEIQNRKGDWNSILPGVEQTNLPRFWVWSVLKGFGAVDVIKDCLITTYSEADRLPKLAEKLLLMWKSTSPHPEDDEEKFKGLIKSISEEYQKEGRASETIQLLLDWCNEPTTENEIRFLEKLLEINKANKDDKEIAKVLLVLSKAWEEIDPQATKKYLDELNEHEVRRGNDTYIWITILSQAQWAKKYTPAEQDYYWNKLIAEHKRLNNRVGIFRTYRHLYFWAQEYRKDKQLNYLNRMLKVAKEDNNQLGLAITYYEFVKWASYTSHPDRMSLAQLIAMVDYAPNFAASKPKRGRVSKKSPRDGKKEGQLIDESVRIEKRIEIPSQQLRT